MSEAAESAWGLIVIGTLIHVFLESKRMRDSGIRNAVMVAVCLWPLGYLLWLFVWPGTLGRKLSGRKPLEPVGRKG